ncbi:hypothetical protein [Stenotrophomonas rhizophila]|uniref:hypothetical protein n=1 Tax=Stenotrophomonas rhizophila TaxID=216778 RepID=UPI001E3676A6|nr:hypothetical protein [Stenotrophomonas rhizophila]MCC7634884.1 hypothetical protein [Stenotrophomonas rhizophila]MCC7664443.1 hypothetical protein [Stenotrophomonas rhizophila]
MTALAWLALACYALAFAVVAVFGAAYLRRSDFMPYHRVAVGRDWEGIDPPVQLLLMALIRVTGAAWLALAGAGVLLLYLLFSSSLQFPHLLAFQAFCLAAMVPPVAVAWHVRKRTGAPTPVVAGAVVVALGLAGFAFAVVSILHAQ